MVKKGLLSRYIGYVNSGCNLKSKLRLTIIIAITNHLVLFKRPRSARRILINLANWLSQGVTTNVNGLKFKLVDYECCYVCTPLFEDWSWEYLHKIKEGDVFVDVGAHVGRYTLPVARMVGEEGLVIAVEANIENYDCLKENIDFNNLYNVIAINAVAWSDNEKLKFYPGESSGRGSTRLETGDKCVEVDARTLDSLLQDLKVSGRVDWIKIDVEGAELEVLKGLYKTLLSSSPKLLVEVSAENRDEFEQHLNTLSYHCYAIANSESRRENKIYYYCWGGQGRV